MGGSAFSAGPEPLTTPRMPKAVYVEAKKRCFDALGSLFDVVDSPIDGPGKTDFGDVDILLFGAKKEYPSKEDALKAMKEAFGAKHHIIEKCDELSAHLAIPWPSDMNDPAVDEDSDKYIQVDVRICTSLERLRWILFKHAHGDAWNLIGTTIRPYGLTVDDEAMWLRVPEIEKTNKKRAKIFLCSDPDRILRFLDLSPSRFWEGPFKDIHDMAEYVANCRMFWVPPIKPEDADSPDVESTFADDRKKLKANDRRRMNSRPGFRVWIDEFFPECRRTGRFTEKKTTREAVTQEAFAEFGPQVEKEYNQQRHDFLIEQQKDFIWNGVIKECIPPVGEPTVSSVKYRSTVTRAFKKIILEGSDQYPVVAPADLKGDDGFFLVEDVKDFIVRHEDEVANFVREKEQASLLEKKKRKTEEAAGTQADAEAKKSVEAQ